MSPSERRRMIRKDQPDASVQVTQDQSRSSIYYTPVGFDQATIDLMHEIGWIFTKYPFFGSRQIASYLPQSGFVLGRHRVHRLMGIMEMQVIYKGPNTSKKHHNIRSIPICCESWPSRDPIKSGVATSPTFQ